MGRVRVQESEREDAEERVSEEPSGWVSGASGLRGGGGARHSAGQRAGRREMDGPTGAHLCPPAPR